MFRVEDRSFVKELVPPGANQREGIELRGVKLKLDRIGKLSSDLPFLVPLFSMMSTRGSPDFFLFAG